MAKREGAQRAPASVRNSKPPPPAAPAPKPKRARRAATPPDEPGLVLARVEGLQPSTDPTLPDFAWWPIARVKPWVQNPRRNKKAILPVAQSIAKFGWGRPLIVNVWPGCEGELIIGHTAWQAALLLKLEQVPVRIRRMEPALAHALALADNKLGEISDWDPDELGRIVGGAEISAADLGIAGFSELELRALMGQGDMDDDEAPPPPRVPVTQPGDLWILGDHRLVCGDATKADAVALALGGLKPRLMTTDPPYGVNLDSTWRDEFSPVKQKHTGLIRNDGRRDWTEAYALFKGDAAYVWHAGVYAAEVAAHLARTKLVVRQQIIWAKAALVMSRGNYHWQHEPCWYVVREGKSSGWVGGRKQTTLWTIQSKVGFTQKGTEDVDTTHGSQKPLECMARPIRNHQGDVYDPFLGSGTTIIAAQKLGRRCVGLELDPGYCDVIVERWQNLTGGKAERTKAAA
jgi:DNA modification methylase